MGKGKGFGGMPGNMQTLMKQAQKMQQEIQRVQEEAEQLTAEGSAGGAVHVVANGKHEILSITIKPEIMDPNDVETLQDALVLACNEALRKAGESVHSSMAKVTGGMNIPGL